ncbi:hypothetical protein MRX96_010908 [Rhipicephalus microplus]
MYWAGKLRSTPCNRLSSCLSTCQPHMRNLSDIWTTPPSSTAVGALAGLDGGATALQAIHWSRKPDRNHPDAIGHGSITGMTSNPFGFIVQLVATLLLMPAECDVLGWQAAINALQPAILLPVNVSTAHAHLSDIWIRPPSSTALLNFIAGLAARVQCPAISSSDAHVAITGGLLWDSPLSEERHRLGFSACLLGNWFLRTPVDATIIAAPLSDATTSKAPICVPDTSNIKTYFADSAKGTLRGRKMICNLNAVLKDNTHEWLTGKKVPE